MLIVAAGSGVDLFPVVLVGVEFWRPKIEFMNQTLVANGTIDILDAQHFFITDSPEQAVDHIRAITIDKFGLNYGPRPKRRWFFFEFGRDR